MLNRSTCCKCWKIDLLIHVFYFQVLLWFAATLWKESQPSRYACAFQLYMYSICRLFTSYHLHWQKYFSLNFHGIANCSTSWSFARCEMCILMIYSLYAFLIFIFHILSPRTILWFCSYSTTQTIYYFVLILVFVLILALYSTYTLALTFNHT